MISNSADPQREEDLRQVHHPRSRWILPIREASYGVVEELKGQEGQEAHQEEGKSTSLFGGCPRRMDPGMHFHAHPARFDSISSRSVADLIARHTSPIQEKDRRALQRHPGAATTDWSLDTGY